MGVERLVDGARVTTKGRPAVVIRSDRADRVVQNADSMQVLTLTSGPEDSDTTDYTVTVDGVDSHLQLIDGGAVGVIDEATGDQIATVHAPWAVDAEGAAVETSFSVAGDTLTQVVQHRSEDVAYPVVSDPWVSFGRYVYVNFDQGDVRSWVDNGVTSDLAVLTGAFCTAVGVAFAPAGAACAVAVATHYFTIKYTFRYARDRNMCVQAGFTYSGSYSFIKPLSC